MTQCFVQRQHGILDKADHAKNTNDYIWDNKMAIFIEQNLHYKLPNFLQGHKRRPD